MPDDGIYRDLENADLPTRIAAINRAALDPNRYAKSVVALISRFPDQGYFVIERIGLFGEAIVPHLLVLAESTAKKNITVDPEGRSRGSIQRVRLPISHSADLTHLHWEMGNLTLYKEACSRPTACRRRILIGGPAPVSSIWTFDAAGVLGTMGAVSHPMPSYTLKINGQARTINVAADTPLLWVLRDHLDLVGTKYGCGMGLCGACTVHLNGAAVRSCQTPVSAVGNTPVTTIEGLDPAGEHPLQKAWCDHDVPQCGYCQAGQIMTAAAFLKQNPAPTDPQIDDAMAGNLCRCGTYIRIRAAIKDAAGMKVSNSSDGPSADGARSAGRPTLQQAQEGVA